MTKRTNHKSAPCLILAASIFIGSNSIVFAASSGDPAATDPTKATTPGVQTKVNLTGASATAANASAATGSNSTTKGANPVGGSATTKSSATTANSTGSAGSAGNASATNVPATNASGTASNATGTASNASGAVTKPTAPLTNSKVSATNAASPTGVANTTNTSNAAGAASTTTAPATQAAASTTAPSTGTDQTATTTATSTSTTKTKWHPGMELSAGTDAQDLVPTDDVELARKQVAAYPDSAEAAFILAVALTRTSRVEEALEEVKNARKLADAKGGATYFDKMIATYEGLLKTSPKENRVRYGLAWAYYMKAYLQAQYSRKVAKFKAAHPELYPVTASANTTNGAAAAPAAAPVAPPKPVNKNADFARAMFSRAHSGKPMDLGSLLVQAGTMNPANAPKIPDFTDGVESADIPQIHKYFEMAITKLDELIAQKPDDVWALVYRAHLKAEYSGNIEESMKVWQACSEKYPNNPASYFFLGEGYLKKGDLKKSVAYVSKAVMLRGQGN